VTDDLQDRENPVSYPEIETQAFEGDIALAASGRFAETGRNCCGGYCCSLEIGMASLRDES
jgi:hypothetical protein